MCGGKGSTMPFRLCTAGERVCCTSANPFSQRAGGAGRKLSFTVFNPGLFRCRAAWLGDTAAIGEYASAGGDVNARDRKGQTALQFAAGAGQPGLLTSHYCCLGLLALGRVAPVDTGVLSMQHRSYLVG